MAIRVREKEIKKAASMAERRAGVTRKQLAGVLKITPDRAKVVLGHAMVKGKWTTDKKGGSGKDNRTLVYTRAKGKGPAKATTRGRKKAKATTRGRKKAKAKK